MVDTIRDGTGSGKQMRVDDENRAQTNAIVMPHASFHAAVKESTYYCNIKHSSVAGSTEEIIGSLVYTGTQQLIVSKSILSFDAHNPSCVRFPFLVTKFSWIKNSM